MAATSCKHARPRLAGNVASSSAISVSVSGGVSDTSAPTVDLVFPSPRCDLVRHGHLSADANDNFGVTEVTFLLDGAVLGTGNRSKAGPWTLDWNTTSTSNGSHSLSVQARDAAGNVGSDSATSITVTQNLPALDETFSNRDNAGDYTDSTGWSGSFVANAANATASISGSQSAYGAASSGLSCSTGLKTQFFTRSVTLGANPRLSYARLPDLKANTNSSYSAYFKVLVNGALVDQQSVSNSTYVDSAWQRREDISLSTYTNQTVTLRFEVGANANVCLEAWARANIDDIRIANAQQDADVTPPTVNLTAPVNGSTVSGTATLSATASDGTSVSRSSSTPMAVCWAAIPAHHSP